METRTRAKRHDVFCGSIENLREFEAAALELRPDVTLYRVYLNVYAKVVEDDEAEGWTIAERRQKLRAALSVADFADGWKAHEALK